MKIQIKRSDVDSMQLYIKYKNDMTTNIQNLRDTKAQVNIDINDIPEKLNKMISLRRDLFKNISQEDFNNIYDYVIYLNREEYEKLINFEVI